MAHLVNRWSIRLVLQPQACALSIKRQRGGAQESPMFPSTPLKSRTARFPRSGSKRRFRPSPSTKTAQHPSRFATALSDFQLDRISRFKDRLLILSSELHPGLLCSTGITPASSLLRACLPAGRPMRQSGRFSLARLREALGRESFPARVATGPSQL